MKLNKRNKIAKEFVKLAELERQKKALEAEIQSTKQSIIDYMDAHGTDILETEEHKATYKLIISHRIDTTALKQKHPKIAEKFTVASEYMRFNFN